MIAVFGYYACYCRVSDNKTGLVPEEELTCVTSPGNHTSPPTSLPILFSITGTKKGVLDTEEAFKYQPNPNVTSVSRTKVFVRYVCPRSTTFRLKECFALKLMVPFHLIGHPHLSGKLKHCERVSIVFISAGFFLLSIPFMDRTPQL